jgi:hypothetical protein
MGDLVEGFIYVMYCILGFGSVFWGIYYLVGGNVTNGLLALILSCVAFSLSFQFSFFQEVREEIRYRIEKRKEGERDYFKVD